MYFKGTILIGKPGAERAERLVVVEADNITEAYAKLIHDCRLIALGAEPSIENGRVVFRRGAHMYAIESVKRTTPEAFLIDHLHVYRDWTGDTEFAQQLLSPVKEAA